MDFDIFRIPFSQSSIFNKLVSDYLSAEDSAKPFYKYKPELSSFKTVFQDKAKEKTNRNTLVNVLLKQYSNANINLSESVNKNIQSLADNKTFTVTTGHQPNLFLGPLYTVYKIVSVIGLAKELNVKYPEYHVVPLYWLNSEDHDFAELNHAYVFNQKLEWKIEDKNFSENTPLGRLKTDSLKPVLEELKKIIPSDKNGTELFEMISSAYLKSENFSDATRVLLNHLFAQFGLVILDSDNAELKREFTEIISEDMFNQHAHKHILETNKKLEGTSYETQVYPREINFFYFSENKRCRIEKRSETFFIEHTDLKFSASEMKNEIATHPEKFSPNVATRGLFQEKVLPNLAYIGGPAETSYWLQYKNMFEHYGINFPMILPRHSAVWIDKSTYSKMNKAGLNASDIFLSKDTVIHNHFIKSNQENLNFNSELDSILKTFESISSKVEHIDVTLKASVEADKQRTINSFKQLEGKLIRALKKKDEVAVNQINSVFEKLFPSGKMQERVDNFIPLYLKYGKELFDLLLENFRSFETEVVVVAEKT